MTTSTPGSAVSALPEHVGIELREAQRAFAGSIDARRRAGEFREAQLRALARRTLSALSADDRARLAEWLSLALAAQGERTIETLQGSIARIDARLAAHVRRALPARVEALAIRGGPSRFVAA
ncbi:MAG TPA: hypothetical protein VJ696_08010 [Rhodanobacteraceae bacterium]|nr:hypothetical protein [Rhodanobacteraceae bacterium]